MRYPRRSRVCYTRSSSRTMSGGTPTGKGCRRFLCATLPAMATATTSRRRPVPKPEPFVNHPISIRFPDDIRAWLNTTKRGTGESFNTIIVAAVTQLMAAEQRKSQRKAVKNAHRR